MESSAREDATPSPTNEAVSQPLAIASVAQPPASESVSQSMSQPPTSESASQLPESESASQPAVSSIASRPPLVSECVAQPPASKSVRQSAANEIACPELGTGWRKISKPRANGAVAGHRAVDHYWISPDGLKFRAFVRAQAFARGSPLEETLEPAKKAASTSATKACATASARTGTTTAGKPGTGAIAGAATTKGSQGVHPWCEGERCEVTPTDEGFDGAWYAATIVRPWSGPPAKNARTQVRYDELTDDAGAPLTEMVPLANVRPLPPPPPSGFLEAASVGGSLELSHEGAWWHVVLRQKHESCEASPHPNPRVLGADGAPTTRGVPTPMADGRRARSALRTQAIVSARDSLTCLPPPASRGSRAPRAARVLRTLWH